MGQFTFENRLTKAVTDVTIYANGMVRFSHIAIDHFKITDTDILWGEDKNTQTLAFQKVSQGRTFRGPRKDTTSCPLEIAKKYGGKYFIKQDGELFILVKDRITGDKK
ncbi:MAG: hypothetical protein K2L72_02950 [Clostridia bacterium]|nr:hypothetical protein [Clostridia bacterium]